MNKDFIEGIIYALRDLEDVYGEGIRETDLWQEFIEGSKNLAV